MSKSERKAINKILRSGHDNKTCSSAGCLNLANHGSICSSCHAGRLREKDPIRYAYNRNKANAKRRGKPHTISLEYFRSWCIKEDYIEGKGRTKDAYSIDCIDPRLGYVEGNLQKMKVGENARKGKKLIYDWMHDSFTVVPFIPPVIDHSQKYF